MIKSTVVIVNVTFINHNLQGWYIAGHILSILFISIVYCIVRSYRINYHESTFMNKNSNTTKI